MSPDNSIEGVFKKVYSTDFDDKISDAEIKILIRKDKSKCHCKKSTLCEDKS